MPRITIGVWIMYALLLTAGYGGNLRAFLLRPGKPTGYTLIFIRLNKLYAENT